jgi:hypothetical protein
VSPPRTPRLAQALLRCIVNTRYRESLEGDLLEELASGRTPFWYWRQVLCAIREQVRLAAREQAVTLVAVTAFFLVALWVIAPATYPVMSWARTTEPLRVVALLGWLTGVPLLLGGIAGVTQRRRHIGAILLGAGIAYLTPVIQPFESAVCDLCAGPGSAIVPATALFLTPPGSALLAGLGAWVAVRFRHTAMQERL